jgi:hypothetical protein
MKPNFWKSLLAAVGICASALVATAAPLHRADIASDPTWLLHLDFDGLRPTAIGKFILSEMDKPEAKARLAVLQSIISVDLRTGLHGATLYGVSSKPEEGVLIVYADFEEDRLVNLAKAATDHQSVEHNKHTIHNWMGDSKKDKDKDKPDEPHRIYAAIAGKRVIFGQRESSVAAALDVLDGSASNLGSGSAFADLGASNTPNFIEGAARKMDLKDSDPKAAMLKFSKSLELAVGQKEQQLQGKLTLEADNEEVAGHMLAIAQGLVALMKFDTSKPEMLKFANALAITQDGPRVVGSITLPANEVVEMMKEGAERKAKEKKESGD